MKSHIITALLEALRAADNYDSHHAFAVTIRSFSDKELKETYDMLDAIKSLIKLEHLRRELDTLYKEKRNAE